MNVAGILHEKSKRNNLYILHNVTSDLVWDLGFVRGSRNPLRDAFSNEYMPSQDIIENKVNYKPRRYKDTVKFNLPLGFGDFNLMIPYEAMKPGRVEFKSFLVASWVQDHDGGSATLDCVSYEAFNPLSDHYKYYTDDKQLGEEALKIRNEFRTSKTLHFNRKLFKESDETNWECEYATKKRSQIVLMKNYELKISKTKVGRYDSHSLSGLFTGEENRTHRGFSSMDVKAPYRNNVSIVLRRSNVQNGIFTLLIEILPQKKKERHYERGIKSQKGMYSVTEANIPALGYAKCYLKK